MPTMQDVARRAKVSLSTVSYAINGTRPISEATRQRIFAAMDELGYHPHALARGLASKRSRIIALHFPTDERGLGFTELEFVMAAADAARERGHHLVMWPFALNDIDELRALAQQGLVDGVVVMEVYAEDRRVATLREMELPFTLIGRCADNTGIDYVDVDFAGTVDEAVRYLAALGHSTIGFIVHSQQEYDSGYGPTVRSSAAFEKAVAHYDLKGELQLCPSSASGGAQALRRLATSLPGMSALLVMSDHALPGVMQELAEQGLAVPDDMAIALIGSSARIGAMFQPTLTTFATPAEEAARTAVNFLIDRLEDSSRRSRQTLISCPLIERESTARPQAPKRAARKSGG